MTADDAVCLNSSIALLRVLLRKCIIIRHPSPHGVWRLALVYVYVTVYVYVYVIVDVA